MRYSGIIAGIVVFSGAGWAAAPEWTAASSDHFELLTTGGARKARAGLQHFEEVRDFFVRALRIDPKLRQKVKLVAFDSPQEWKRFSPGEGTAAYYQSGLDRDTIVMESLREGAYQIAVHEYVHLLLRHSGGTFPVWLNEGMADLYSSMNAMGGKMRVGDILPGRYLLLKQSKWLPMEQLMEVDHASPIYRGKDHKGVLYSQSWALTHMLMLGDQYRPKVGEFINKVVRDETPAPKAFLEVYGKTLFKVQKDLEDYLGANSIRIYLFDYKAEKQPKYETRPATQFESDLAVARLLSRKEDPRDAEEIFTRLEEQDANHVELAEASGFHYLMNQKPEEARKRFERAMAAGSVNPKIYRQAAFLLQGSNSDEAVKAMKRAVELDPADREMRYFLGRMLLTAKKYGEALSTLTEARPIPPEHTFGFFEALTYIYLNFKKPADARVAASRAETVAKEDGDKRRAASLLRYIGEYERAESQRQEAEERYRKYQEERAKAQAAGSAESPIPVYVKRGEEIEPAERKLIERTTEPGSTLPKVTGKLRRVDCAGQRAVLHVFAEGKLQRFTIDDPGSVFITGTGANGSTAEFSCGPQKEVPVEIGHTGGVVKTLGFR